MEAAGTRIGVRSSAGASAWWRTEKEEPVLAKREVTGGDGSTRLPETRMVVRSEAKGRHGLDTLAQIRGGFEDFDKGRRTSGLPEHWRGRGRTVR
ncbi:hypothetical protein M6B38_255970 [Iris pallida]|uniref:Uncharacterized protein n=1 Tax=Iris pallida TaxID=29817 RepID=A0AAX6IHS7_IRIPA|nr:hypothetical protein M6B38_324250 [Iris pallida]KAJ6852493.1 hypothetical protein M6B38_255970 [Iris pallida]